MTAKEYLSQFLRLDRTIHNKLEQLEAWKSLSMKVTAHVRQDSVSGGATRTSPMADAIVRMVDLETEINADIDRLVDLRQDILQAIRQLPCGNAQLVLEMRYITGKSWEEIAAVLGYDRSWVFRVHGRSLKEIEEIRSMRGITEPEG